MIEDPQSEAPEPSFTDDEHGASEPQDENAGPAPAAVEPSPDPVPAPSATPWVEGMIEALSDQTVDELTDIAKGRGMSGYSTLSKDELAKAIAADYRERPPLEPRIG